MAPRTVLQTVQDSAYAIGIPAPSTLFGSTGPDARQWLQFFYEAGEWVRNEFDYPALKAKYTLQTVAGTKFYPLPGDFWRLLRDTQWDDTNEWALFGPVQDHKIASRDKGTTLNDTQYLFRITGAPFQTVGQTTFNVSGGYIELSPTPSDVRTLSMEYISANWFFPRQWVASTSYTSGDLRSANGAIYKAGSTATSGATRPTGESASDGTITWTKYRDHYDAIQNDSDYPLIDPTTLKHAIRVAFMRAKGQDPSSYEQQAILSAKRAMGRFQGNQGVSSDGDLMYEFPWVSEDFVATGF